MYSEYVYTFGIEIEFEKKKRTEAGMSKSRELNTYLYTVETVTIVLKPLAIQLSLFTDCKSFSTSSIDLNKSLNNDYICHISK